MGRLATQDAAAGAMLAPDFRALARAMGVVVRYRAGDAVFREGDAPAHMYVVLAGCVEISANGRTIDRVGVGRTVGVVSLIDDLKRTATARALEDCELALIDRRKFRIMIEETPNFVWYVLGELADRLRATNAAR